ncbi:sensor histidine kinase [uncultured Caulobacter sp.]|uniref:sensor histidine kinase n=1 Tax=uncultured Caulobacter sp. TaxID=158749 RepID=UPI002612E91D|nr:PAS domain-containing sensor histidine kinase [uncultured Caulobacter sp.]
MPSEDGRGEDITRKLAAATARAQRQEELFHELIERCPFGIYLVDADFKIASMNLRSQQGAFANVRPVIGRPFEEAMRVLWPEDVAQEIIGHFRRTLDTGEPFYSRDFYRPRNDIEDVEGYEWELQRTRTPDGRFGVVCYYYDSTELRRAQQQISDDQRRLRLLVDELNHRVKNTLAIVQSLSAQSFRRPDIPADARQAFEGRLEALAGAHDVLTSARWERADLAMIVVGGARACGVEDRILVDGPAVGLKPQTAVTMAMAVHELLTNALKYGALSNATGGVRVAWTVEAKPDPRLRWTWREHGGPPVAAPTRRGFGSRLLESALAAEAGGVVEMNFAPDGLVCVLEASLKP